MPALIVALVMAVWPAPQGASEPDTCSCPYVECDPYGFVVDCEVTCSPGTRATCACGGCVTQDGQVVGKRYNACECRPLDW